MTVHSPPSLFFLPNFPRDGDGGKEKMGQNPLFFLPSLPFPPPMLNENNIIYGIFEDFPPFFLPSLSPRRYESFSSVLRAKYELFVLFPSFFFSSFFPFNRRYGEKKERELGVHSTEFFFSLFYIPLLARKERIGSSIPSVFLLFFPLFFPPKREFDRR